jgi:hypothetical protein
MKRNLFLLCLIFSLSVGQSAIGKVRKSKVPKKKTKIQRKLPKPSKQIPEVKTTIAPVVPVEETPRLNLSPSYSELLPVAKYKLNTAMGMTITKGSAFNSAMQFGAVLSRKFPLYLGPDFSFSLFSPGNIFFIGGGGWYEFRWESSPKLLTCFGAVGGPAFVSQVGNFSPTNLAIFLDLALAQEVDDLFLIRGQMRPGFIGKTFAFMMNFNVSFRFP